MLNQKSFFHGKLHSKSKRFEKKLQNALTSLLSLLEENKSARLDIISEIDSLNNLSGSILLNINY